MLLAVPISSYGCTWEVWRALRKLELLSAAPQATLMLLSCSPNFPCASITWYMHDKHEPILKYHNGGKSTLIKNSFIASFAKLFFSWLPWVHPWQPSVLPHQVWDHMDTVYGWALLMNVLDLCPRKDEVRSLKWVLTMEACWKKKTFIKQ